MSAVIEAIDDLTTVRAVLNYTRNTGIRPVNYTFEPPPGVPRNSGEIDARTVTINDARRVNGLELDVSGFELLGHHSSLTDWNSFRDAERVKAVDWTGETYSVAFNPRHRWYWYPRQAPSEATLLKLYD